MSLSYQPPVYLHPSPRIHGPPFCPYGLPRSVLSHEWNRGIGGRVIFCDGCFHPACFQASSTYQLFVPLYGFVRRHVLIVPHPLKDTWAVPAFRLLRTVS